MERYSSCGSNFSVDSLETELKKRPAIQNKPSEDNVEILVPFYEKDVLIKVPKSRKAKDNQEGKKSKNLKDKFKKDHSPVKNYLVNKDANRSKHTSYLEMFRKQFAPTQTLTRKIGSEIRSISPEFGDTERESFAEDSSNPVNDFFNTESYNEMYYEKLINQELNTYLEQTYEEQLKFSGDIRSKSPEDIDYNNLRSVSDVSQPRRHIRRATVQPIQEVKLGGLGPDLEKIKPRLERARSLQRYSEKVRMENRVKIYKKSVKEEIEKKAEKEMPIRRRDSTKFKECKDSDNTYLVNKNNPDKHSQIIRRICNSKSKSANVQRTKPSDEIKDQPKISNDIKNQNNDINKQHKRDVKNDIEKRQRIKSCNKVRTDNNTDEDPATVGDSIPPVHISFLVNVGGIRPSSALRTLEAKHLLYQEKVRAFTNNEEDKDNDD